MRALKTQNGYTIVEVLIVLAVTSVMFTMTVLLVSGQVERYRYKQVTYNSQERIQGAINDVQSGYFDLVDAAPASCSDDSTPGAGNSKCIYAGKKIEVTNTGTLVTTPLFINDDESPFTAGVNPQEAPAVTEQLPGGVNYENKSFYVLFNNYYDSAGSFEGGSQSVGIYASENGGSLPATGLTICLTGSRESYLVVGANKTKDVQIVYEDCP